MNFDLTDEQRDIQRLARDFADGEVRPVAEELDREKRFPYEIVKKLGGLGLMGMPFPQEYGGGGTDNVSYAIAVEELTRVNSSVAITMAAHTSACASASASVRPPPTGTTAASAPSASATSRTSPTHSTVACPCSLHTNRC